MSETLNDELKIYRGEDYYISDKIKLHIPTLGEICDFGEYKYFNIIYGITSVAADMKWQLYDCGVDYTTIDDFTLFRELLSKTFSKNDTSIIFGDLDLSKFKIYKDTTDGNIFMYDAQNDIKIDEYTYMVIMDALRQIHFLKRNSQIPANESTKMILIEDAREEYLRSKDEEKHSMLKNLVSAMINSEGFKYNHSQVWDVKINVFLDSVKRIMKISNSKLLLQSGYSGFGLDLTKISDKETDWIGELS